MSLHTIYSMVLFFMFFININAQIPNNSFEQWKTNGEPEGWRKKREEKQSIICERDGYFVIQIIFSQLI